MIRMPTITRAIRMAALVVLWWLPMASLAAERFRAPHPPAKRPLIAATYPHDRDGDRVADGLRGKQQAARRAMDLARTPGERAIAQAAASGEVAVELIFNAPIDDLLLEAFEHNGGKIEYVYSTLSYGWNARIPLDAIDRILAAMGNSLVLLDESMPLVKHLDFATQTGRVRPIWAAVFAGGSGGFSGSTNITIAIVDTGVDETHADLIQRRVYWQDFSDDNSAVPRDLDQHGSHVAGIALGTGQSAGSTAGSLYYTDHGDLTGVPSGSFFPSPVSLPPVSLTFSMIAQWLGGGSSTHYLVYRGTGSSGSYTIQNSTAGTSPLTLSPTFSPVANRIYSAGLASNGSISNYVIAVNVNNYDTPGDGFNRLRGVAPSCNWAGAKVFTDAGDGNSTWLNAGLDSITANRTAKKIKVMNVSIGFPGAPGISTSTRQKINTAANLGILVAVSAGNEGSKTSVGDREIDDPGRAAYALTVGAASDTNRLASYSSIGFTNPSSTPGQEEDYKPDLIAPGGSDYQTWILAVDSNTGDGSGFADQRTNDYYNIKGTSMASPFVAGCAALVIDALEKQGLVWDFNSSQHPMLIKMLLTATATESNADRESVEYNPTLDRASNGLGYPVGKDRYEGYGNINPDAAIEAIVRPYSLGNTVGDTFGTGPTAKRAAAWAVTLAGGVTATIALTVPDGADFDFYLYRRLPGTYGAPVILASSTSTGAGADESVTYTPAVETAAILVVKRIAGSGAFSVSSLSPAPVELTVASDYGIPSPATGVTSYAAGTLITAGISGTPFVSESSQQRITAACTGWVGTGSVPASGSGTNITPFVILADSSITWLWEIVHLAVSNQTVTSTTTLKATETVTAGTGFLAAPPADITMEAGQLIRLTPGFAATTGSVVRMRIQQP